MRFIAKKLSYALLTLWVIVTITFILMKLLPGDPFTFEKGIPEVVQTALREQHGLNDSYLVQYWRFINLFIRGNFGNSLITNRNVNDLILETFPISAALALEALLIAIPVGIAMGTLAALKKERWQDHLLLFFNIFSLSIPSFILATVLQYYFAFKWSFFPIARWGTFTHSILPAITLAVAPTILLARLTRSSVIDVLKQDYVKTAFAKGLPFGMILRKHIIRNALPPLLPYLGQLVANILVGSFVVEKIFSIPGLGQWFVSSIGNRDYGNIMGLTLFYGLILLIVLFIADLLYGWLDPRIRMKE